MALKDFQKNYGLEENGQINEPTKDKLIEIHGS
jgi:hypothetical protein